MPPSRSLVRLRKGIEETTNEEIESEALAADGSLVDKTIELFFTRKVVLACERLLNTSRVIVLNGPNLFSSHRMHGNGIM